MEDKRLFCIIDWDDGYSNDIPLSCIRKPRKEQNEYVLGERVEALLPNQGKYWGVIAAIDGMY